WIFLVVAALVGVDALVQHFSGVEFLRQRSAIWMRDGLYAVTGPFRHYNNLGAYLVCVLSMAIVLFSSKEIKMWLRMFLFFTAILCGWALLLTLSRGSWVGMGVSLVFMVCLSRRTKIILPVLGVFILILILTPIIKERFFHIFESGGDSGRFGIWQSAWAMVKENPFLGKGLGTFMSRFSQYVSPGAGLQYTHNCFLQVWAETGIFALLSFLSFLSILLVRSTKVCWNSSEPVLLGLICGISGFLAHSFFDTQFYSLQLAVLMWVLLGITSSLTSISAGSVDQEKT
ncbi:MAG: O-antigen ligase family protein, partial [Candidatus Omnitrophica bacterium]|nr:O-antigen ligase family protein [Candidatus Omnitrophota bacterium]